MEQQDLYEKSAKIQEERMQEMEQAISLPEEENSQQRQLIEKLREENPHAGKTCRGISGSDVPDAPGYPFIKDGIMYVHGF